MRILSCCFPKSLQLHALKRIKCLGNLGNSPSVQRFGDAARAISGVAREVCIRCGYTSIASANNASPKSDTIGSAFAAR